MSEAGARRLYCSRCLNTFEADLEQCPSLSCRRKKPTRGWGVIFAEGDIFDRNYRIHKMLAVGGAGVTYLAREIDANGEDEGPRLAIKVLLAARDAGPYVRRLATEAQIIQELDHPNIVQYLGFVHRAGHSPYLLTRFESGGSLLDHMRRVGTLSVRAACLVGRQICWALEKAHERGIVHRDLKPENVLLSRTVAAGEDPAVRVADFGIAKVQGSLNTNLTRVGAFVGTPHYAAPEQFIGGVVTEAADVYAVGALVYFCIAARHVARFTDRLDPEEGFQLLCDHLPPVLDLAGEDPQMVAHMNQVLAVAMRVDPKQRCTVVALDTMLDAVASGRAPVLPAVPELAPDVALAPPAVTPPPLQTALLVHSPAPAAVEMTQSEPTMAGGEPDSAPVATPGPRAQPTPLSAVVAPTPAPVRPAAADAAIPAPAPAAATPAAAPSVPRRRGLGCAAGVMGLLVVGLLLGLVAVGAVLAARPEWRARVPGMRELGLGAPTAPAAGTAPQPGTPTVAATPAPVDIAADSPDRGASLEYARLVRSIEGRKDWLVQRCGAPPAPVELGLTVVVEADGRTRSAAVTGADAALGSCLESGLVQLKHKRTLSKAVRLQAKITVP